MAEYPELLFQTSQACRLLIQTMKSLRTRPLGKEKGLRGLAEQHQRLATLLRRDIRVGALIGSCSAIAIAWSAAPVIMLVAALLGFWLGALVGLLLWLGSAEFPDQIVIPAAPGMARSRPSQPVSRSLRCRHYRRVRPSRSRLRPGMRLART